MGLEKGGPQVAGLDGHRPPRPLTYPSRWTRRARTAKATTATGPLSVDPFREPRWLTAAALSGNTSHLRDFQRNPKACNRRTGLFYCEFSRRLTPMTMSRNVIAEQAKLVFRATAYDLGMKWKTTSCVPASRKTARKR